MIKKADFIQLLFFSKKLLVLSFMVLLCLFQNSGFLSAEEQNVLVKKNEYGGKTIQFIYDPEDKYYVQLTSSTYYYDMNGEVCKVIHNFNEQQSLLTGFTTQEERLENGIVLSYKLTLTTKQRAEQGIDYLIEYMGKDGQVIRKQIVKGELSRTEGTGSFTDTYPFYALDVLEKYLIQDDTQEIVSDRSVYKFSAFFNRGRSFVKFNSGTKGLSDTDKSMIAAYMDCYNQQYLAKMFVKKADVTYGNQTYTAYIHESLIPFVKKKKDCLLSYSVVMLNGKMCLLVTDIGSLD